MIYERLTQLTKTSGVVAMWLEDASKGRVSTLEAMLSMIEDLVGVNQRLAAQQPALQSDQDVLAEIQADLDNLVEIGEIQTYTLDGIEEEELP
jgi:hypothetical protein